jgi:hypothetical protein
LEGADTNAEGDTREKCSQEPILVGDHSLWWGREKNEGYENAEDKESDEEADRGGDIPASSRYAKGREDARLRSADN